MAKKKFLKDYKYWSWWESMTEQEQETILRTVYLLQEIGEWYEAEEE